MRKDGNRMQHGIADQHHIGAVYQWLQGYSVASQQRETASTSECSKVQGQGWSKQTVQHKTFTSNHAYASTKPAWNGCGPAWLCCRLAHTENKHKANDLQYHYIQLHRTQSAMATCYEAGCRHGALCPMELDVVIFRVIGFMLVVSVSQYGEPEVGQKGLVQGSATHPESGCAAVLSVTSRSASSMQVGV